MPGTGGDEIEIVAHQIDSRLLGAVEMRAAKAEPASGVALQRDLLLAREVDVEIGQQAVAGEVEQEIRWQQQGREARQHVSLQEETPTLGC